MKKIRFQDMTVHKLYKIASLYKKQTVFGEMAVAVIKWEDNEFVDLFLPAVTRNWNEEEFAELVLKIEEDGYLYVVFQGVAQHNPIFKILPKNDTLNNMYLSNVPFM